MHSILKLLKASRRPSEFVKFNLSLQRNFCSKDTGNPPTENLSPENLPQKNPPQNNLSQENPPANELGGKCAGSETNALVSDEEELRAFYPEPKLNIPRYHRGVLEIWKDEMIQVGKFLKDPKNESPRRSVAPSDVEILVIGAGAIGASIAYWLQTIGGKSMDVMVIDKDLSPSRLFTSKMINVIPRLAVGHLTQQFGLKENIELAKFAAEFVREMEKHLIILDEFNPIQYKPFGHLNLASKKSVESLKQNHIEQGRLGVHTELMTAFQLGQRFPWLRTDDVALGCHGLVNEGWFDPLDYVLNIRRAAMRKGVLFLEAEPLEFLYDGELSDHIEMSGFRSGEYQPCNHVYVKESNGNIRKIEFAVCILAIGAETGEFTKNFLSIRKDNGGMFQFEVPIEKKKRHVYCFEAPDGGPGLSSPMVNDPTGLFFRREGLNNMYVCGCPPPPAEEPKTDNLEHDSDYFYNRVWPLLAQRVPMFEQLNLKSMCTYFDDCNTFDGSPIIGYHPAYHNFILACGFGNKAHQYAPGVGRAVAELFVHGFYHSIELTRFNFNRIVQEVPITETCIL